MSLSKIQIALFSAVLIMIDFFTKNMVEQKSYIISNSLKLRLVHQYPKFDLISQFSGYSMQIAIGGAILSLIIMGYFYTQYFNRVILFSIGMIMAGVIGNLIDHIYFGWSRVFINFQHPKLYMFFDTPQFPLFNFADILIVCGALIFIFNKKW